ncbi:MAG: hypothetical protein ACJAYJ_000759 [Saprospiraceae bacterium]|jgi:hypothetical protein
MVNGFRCIKAQDNKKGDTVKLHRLFYREELLIANY